MRRALALTIALIALFAAGFVWTRDRPVAVATELPPPPVAMVAAAAVPLVAPAAEVSPQDREARRFGRYDRNRDARISRDEYLANRQKAFARLDSDGDGRLAFNEYAARTAEKFRGTDRDANGVLTTGEFATTAPKPRSRPSCACDKDGSD